MPNDVRQGESIDSFKRKLKSFISRDSSTFLMATTFIPLK